MSVALDFGSMTRALSDFQNADINTLVEGLFNHPSLTLLYAPSGGQKSLLALDMASCVATGGEFLGYKCSQTNTLYIDGEMSDYSIKRRASEMSITGIPINQLGYLTPQDNNLDFDDGSTQDDFINYIKESGYKFIVIDNLRVLLGIEDENDSACFYKFNGFLRRLRDCGCSVLVIHHANKAAEQYAGSSNIVTVFDYVIGLSGDSSQKDKLIKINKIRDDTQLSGLDGQYLRYYSDGFKLNSHADLDIETVVNGLISKVGLGEVATIKDALIYMRESGIKVDSGKWSYSFLFDEYIKPYCTHVEIAGLKELKEMFRCAKKKDLSVDIF